MTPRFWAQATRKTELPRAERKEYMREVGLEKGHIRVSSIQNVGKGNSILVLESLRGYDSHINNSNSMSAMPPSLNHYYIQSLIHSFIPLFNKCLLSVHSVSNSVLSLGTCSEQEILDSFPYKTYNLEGKQ